MDGRLVTAAEMRELDRRTIEWHGVPSMVLMERAALASVDVLASEGFDLSWVLAVCGPGNNGGDGMAVARLLHLAGHRAEIAFVGDIERRSEETRRQQGIAEGYGVRVQAGVFGGATTGGDMPPSGDGRLAMTEGGSCKGIGAGQAAKAGDAASPFDGGGITTVVDAIFGIGGGRAPEGEFLEAVRYVNALRKGGARVLALDIPSGVCADTGEAPGEAVQADATVTFAYMKRGLALPPGSGLAGRVIVKDIGIY